MHLLTEQNIRINRPINVVFDYVTNMEQFGDWFPGVLAIKSANDHLPGQIGKEYLETVAIPLRGERKIRLVVREAEINKLFVTEGKLSPLLPRMEVRFQVEDSDSCQVTWRMLSRNSAVFFRLTLLPIARAVLQKRAAIGLGKLKRNLERIEAQPIG